MNKNLSSEQVEKLLTTLKTRFEKHNSRHPQLAWTDIEARLLNNTKKMWSLNEMERTGGEPDVIGMDASTQEYIFFDCSKESPEDRRSLCYDREALNSRKKFPPENSVLDMVESMGVELFNEENYRQLQTIGSFDLKTSSWIETPKDIRKLGGALFCDCRYNHVFVYHNGADSYYATRGFRTLLRV